jgi:hypothetical protein
MTERVWTVQYGYRMPHGPYAYEVGCVCSKYNRTYGLPKEHWEPHYHQDGAVYRKPDRIIRHDWDKDGRPSWVQYPPKEWQAA